MLILAHRGDYPENNLKVYVYTVNSFYTMRELVEVGVEVIFTDYPKLMK